MKNNLPSILKKSLLALVCASGLMTSVAHAQVTTVFYILLENRNWTENETSGGAQILGNSAAPYLNSLVTPGNTNAAHVAYASCYHNDLATPSGVNPSIHPSEPNYVWMECGSNLSKADDNDPYGIGASVQQIFNYAAANSEPDDPESELPHRAVRVDVEVVLGGSQPAQHQRSKLQHGWWYAVQHPCRAFGLHGAAGELQRNQRQLHERVQRHAPVQLCLQAYRPVLLPCDQRQHGECGQPRRRPTSRRRTTRPWNNWRPTWPTTPARLTT